METSFRIPKSRIEYAPDPSSILRGAHSLRPRQCSQVRSRGRVGGPPGTRTLGGIKSWPCSPLPWPEPAPSSSTVRLQGPRTGIPCVPVSLGVRFAGVAATEAMDGSFRLVPRPTLRGRFSDSPKVAAVNASASARALARSSKYGTDESSKNCIELRVCKVQLDFNGPSATNGIPELLKSMVRPQPLSGSCPR